VNRKVLQLDRRFSATA